MVALSPENKAIATILSDTVTEYTQSGKARQLSLQLEEFEGCRLDVSIAVYIDLRGKQAAWTERL